MYNIPLPGSTVATSPLPQPNSGADVVAALVPSLVNDINTNIGGRIASMVASTNSVTSSSALVVASINTGVTLGSLLAPRSTGASGVGLRFKAWGTYGATTTPKTVSLVVGTTSLSLGATGSTTVAGTGWYGSIDMYRSAANSQTLYGVGASTAPSAPNASVFGTASNAESAAATFALIGTSTAAVAGDIVVSGMVVEWLP